MTTPEMKPLPKKEWVAGFLFTEDWKSVALIKKARPEWQAGKLNGVGGHIEQGEFPYQAMRREWNEEAGAAEHNWREYLHLDRDQGTVHFFTAYTAYKTDYFGGPSDEPVHWYKVEDVLAGKLNTIPNLRWLIPMAMDHENCTALVLEPSEGLAWQTRPTPQPSSEYVKAIDSLEKALDEQENDGIVSDNDFKDIRHSKDGNNPIAYLTEWLRITRPRTVATKDGSWGELEKRLHLVFREYANGKVLKMRVKDALSALKSHPTPAKEPDHEQ